MPPYHCLLYFEYVLFTVVVSLQHVPTIICLWVKQVKDIFIKVVQKAASVSLAVAITFSLMLATPAQLHAGIVPIQVGKLCAAFLQ